MHAPWRNFWRNESAAALARTTETRRHREKEEPRRARRDTPTWRPALRNPTYAAPLHSLRREAVRTARAVLDGVRDNPAKGRYELEVHGEIVFANYRRAGSTLVISHVEAPRPLRGTGAAGRL